MQETKIEPQDVIDAIKSIEVKHRLRCDWLNQWLSEDQMLEWAEDALKSTSDRGNADAITWAKRAICARIDRFLNLCLLSRIAPPQYPARIELLREVGIGLPDVMYEFVIEPRNDLEHLYRMPSDQKVAKHAVEIAQLGLSVTRDHLTGLIECLCGCIALNWNVLSTYRYSGRGLPESLEVKGFSSEPMIFADVFNEPIMVKIVDPANNEIRFSPLSNFDRGKLIELCVLLNRWSGNERSRHESREPPHFVTSAKKQLRF